MRAASANRRIVVGEPARCVALDQRAGGAAIEDEECGKFLAEDPCFSQEPKRLRRGPSVEEGRLSWDQDEVGGEKRRAHQARDAWRSTDDHMIDIAGHLGRLMMQGASRELNAAEEAWNALSRALVRPIEGRALRIRDDRDSLSFPGPLASKVHGKRRLSDAALLVEERDDHCPPPSVFHRGTASPASKTLDSSLLDSKLGGSEEIGLLAENAAPGSR